MEPLHDSIHLHRSADTPLLVIPNGAGRLFLPLRSDAVFAFRKSFRDGASACAETNLSSHFHLRNRAAVMKTRDLGELAVRNLREAILRNSLTTLGVAVGVASLVAMLSLGVGLQQLASSRLTKSGLFDSIFVTAKTNLRGPGAGPPPTRAPAAKPRPLDHDRGVLDERRGVVCGDVRRGCVSRGVLVFDPVSREQGALVFHDRVFHSRVRLRRELCGRAVAVTPLAHARLLADAPAQVIE